MRSVMTWLVVGTLALPGLAAAQQSWQEVQVADIETMRDKFVGLAGALDASQYEWRPMEGVRSVREVLALTVAEAHLFPTLWGARPPERAESGFEAEMARAQALSRADLIRELEVAFEFFRDQVAGMDEETRMSDGSYFGRPMPTHASLSMALADMHEHLGQLIAYARTNQVVPPWSRSGMD